MRDAGTRDDPLRDRRESRFASRVGIGVRQFRARNLRTQITRPPLCERTYGFRLPHGLIRRNPTQLRLPPKGERTYPPKGGAIRSPPLGGRFASKKYLKSSSLANKFIHIRGFYPMSAVFIQNADNNTPKREYYCLRSG